MSNHDNLATNRDLRKITDHAIKIKQGLPPGTASKEYKRIVQEQMAMMSQIKRERRD